MAGSRVRHLGLKVVSVVLAALLWLVVAGEQIVERALRIPIEFTNVPPDLELIGDAPTVADVRVRGSSGALSRMSPGEMVALLDLRTARPGVRLFHLSGADVRAPFGVQVVQVSPSNISIRLERSVTKAVPVVPEIDGQPAAGFVVGRVVVDPATVEVIGPAGAVGRLTTAITEPVSVEGATTTVTESVNVGAPIAAIRLRDVQSVQVTVHVVPAPLEWAIASVPVVARNAGRGVQIAPGVVTVHVRAGRDTVRPMADDLEVSVDVAGLRAGRHELPVRVVPAAGVELVRVEPATVQVLVR
jgi:YbbR domain-containing protein